VLVENPSGSTVEVVAPAVTPEPDPPKLVLGTVGVTSYMVVSEAVLILVTPPLASVVLLLVAPPALVVLKVVVV
jgi:hypothetical protein